MPLLGSGRRWGVEILFQRGSSTHDEQMQMSLAAERWQGEPQRTSKRMAWSSTQTLHDIKRVRCMTTISLFHDENHNEPRNLLKVVMRSPWLVGGSGEPSAEIIVGRRSLLVEEANSSRFRARVTHEIWLELLLKNIEIEITEWRWAVVLMWTSWYTFGETTTRVCNGNCHQMTS